MREPYCCSGLMEGRITILGEFRDAGLEREFRGYALDYTRRLTLIIGGAVLIGSLTFMWNDLADPAASNIALASRAGQVLCALLGIALAYRLRRWQSVYTACYLLCASLLAAMLVVAWNRPSNYLLHLGMDSLLTLSAYLVLPTVISQILLGWSFTIALLVLHFTVKQPLYDLAHLTVPAALVAANITGLIVSGFYNRARRTTYLQMQAEQAMRLQLEQAQQEIEELTQLIPMCAACKKVRNDAGYWEQVEVFMRNVGGNVSHGMCPQCAEQWLRDAGLQDQTAASAPAGRPSPQGESL